MKRLIKSLAWIDNHIIKILLTFFLFVNPLLFKIRLSHVNYTYISIRPEDFIVALIFAVFLIQLLRKKVTINLTYFRLILFFWVAVYLAYLVGFYWQKTVVISHLGMLHVLRRIEYMSLFFVAFATVRSKADLWYYLKIIFITILLVNLYGLGQKFLGWPAMQTMNPEYSKGYLLYLTPEARITSTFGGHYDLAAYVVFLIPILLGAYFIKNRVRYLLLAIFSIFILVLTASRASYISFLLTSFPFLIVFRKPKVLAIVLICTAIFTFSSKGLTSRMKRTFQVKQIFINPQTGQVVVPQKITTKEVPAGTFYVPIDRAVDNNPITIGQNQALAQQKILEDIRDEASKSGKVLTKQEEDALVASIAARLKPISTVVSDISFATRLQLEWPRAINAFIKHPLLGVGPSALTEATDSDYFRWLGETGIIGTLAFVAVLLYLFRQVFIAGMSQAKDQKMLYFGFLFGSASLLITASYFDIFEASKIAFQFWMTGGLFAAASLLKKNEKNYKK